MRGEALSPFKPWRAAVSSLPVMPRRCADAVERGPALQMRRIIRTSPTLRVFLRDPEMRCSGCMIPLRVEFRDISASRNRVEVNPGVRS